MSSCPHPRSDPILSIQAARIFCDLPNHLFLRIVNAHAAGRFGGHPCARRKKNVVRGITGALVYSDGVFLQILEGDRANVQQLMVKILQDLRHGTVTVLQEGEIACAVFGRWQMAYVSATAEQVAAWAGIGVAAEGHEMVSSSGQDPHRAAQFAQSILALLSPGIAAQTKAD